MTAKAVLAKALLEGNVLTVANCFRLIGLTNIAREIPRMIEKPYDIVVSRNPVTGKSKYGQPVSYVEYRLNHTSYNHAGIKKLKEYVAKHYPEETRVEYSQLPLL